MIGEADGKHPILPVSHVHTWAGCTGCPTLKDCEICGLGRHPKLHNSSATQPATGKAEQCKNCHLTGLRTCIYHGYPEDSIPEFCGYKIGSDNLTKTDRQDVTVGMVYAYEAGQSAAEQRIAEVIAATLPILESLEWSGTHDFGDEDNWAVLTKDICPYCYGRKKNGHKPDCKLGKAISLLRGDGKP